MIYDETDLERLGEEPFSGSRVIIKCELLNAGKALKKFVTDFNRKRPGGSLVNRRICKPALFATS